MWAAPWSRNRASPTPQVCTLLAAYFDLQLYKLVLPVFKISVNEIIDYVFFLVWLLLLKIYIYEILLHYFLAVLGLRFCARAFSSCGKQGPLFIAVRGPLTIAASLVGSTGSRHAGSVVVAHGPSCSVACGSSQTRARTHVPCIGRQILNHCATREARDSSTFCMWLYFVHSLC